MRGKLSFAAIFTVIKANKIADHRKTLYEGKFIKKIYMISKVVTNQLPPTR